MCVTEWQTLTETDGESEVRSGPWEIFKASCHDTRVGVITHSVCPPCFMEWDRNSPSNNTKTLAYVLGCCTQNKLLTGHFEPAQLLNKRSVVSRSLTPSFYHPPLSFWRVLLFKCAEKWNHSVGERNIMAHRKRKLKEIDCDLEKDNKGTKTKTTDKAKANRQQKKIVDVASCQEICVTLLLQCV